MKKLWLKLTALYTFLFVLLPCKAMAAGGGGELIVIVADTRRFSGWQAWWTNLYNDTHLGFALVTIILIPIIGVIMGVLADIVMSRIGIDLKSRDLAEH